MKILGVSLEHKAAVDGLGVFTECWSKPEDSVRSLVQEPCARESGRESMVSGLGRHRLSDVQTAAASPPEHLLQRA